MPNAADVLQRTLARRRWLVPDPIVLWARRFGSVEEALAACPFAHWAIVLGAIGDARGHRVVRAAAQTVNACGVGAAAASEPGVAAAVDRLLRWDARRRRSGADPWEMLPAVPEPPARS